MADNKFSRSQSLMASCVPMTKLQSVIRANDGLKGTGNSKNANTYDIAASRAVIVIVLVETKFFLVLIVAVLLLINLLFVRYA